MEKNWLVYVNGEMVPMKDAKISVFDRAFQYGDGVFEGIRCYDSRIFKLKEHIDRLYRSAAMVDIEIPMSKAEFCEVIKRVIRENKFTDAHVKPVISRGTAWSLGLDPRNTTEATVVIPARPIGKSMFDINKGFKLASVSTRKVPAMCLDPRVKSCNYLVHILARQQALAAGANEAIMYDINGYVSEGCGDNIFLVKDNILYTPQVQDALEGITRETVIEIADRLKIKLNETRLTSYDVYNADEIFVTGSGAGIIGVTEVDKRIVSEGKMGTITHKLYLAYEEEVRNGEPI